MPNNVKTYDGTGDPEDHVKNFQAAAQVERWAMPTWCHMFNSTLIGTARVWFDELPPESIDGYKDLKAAFLAYFMQQKKYVKDPVEIHNIKQRDGETIEDFMERFKVETGRMKGAPECMRISGFMHGVNNPELTKRLNEHVPKTMEEMMTVTTAFIRGETAAASKKKGHAPWKPQDQPKRHVSERKSDFRGKFKPPPPMVTPVEKRSSNKFCDFHNDKGHSTDECMQLKNQIEELVRAGKLSHLIKEIKQGRDQTKVGKKETPAKDKSLAIYMVQPWHRMTRQKVTQSFARVSEITFPPLTTSKGTEGPLVIEAEIGGHMIHRMYVDGGSSTEVLYEHCFNRLRPEIKSQMVPATTSLTGFSGETIWPLGQLRLLVTIGDADHSTKAWMNFMIVRSLSPYNGIIGRSGIREIQAVPSTAHGMLKFPVDGVIVTIRSTILIPAECGTVITSSKETLKEAEVRHENFKVALHPNFPDQEVAIGKTLSAKGRTKLCSLLKKNLDIFAWQPSDMTRKKKGQAPERAKAIQAKVQKLVAAGIMNKVYYHDWLSNPVMVKKHDGSWRMCVDFTDLNKACPQDCYPLLEIDWKVESLYSYPFKCFLDAYKGYHQIQMADLDEEKTAFNTSQGVYCYTKMPFGLKNADTTYQRLVDKAFNSQVSQNIEVYVDNLVIKSHTETEMLRDIKETFPEKSLPLFKTSKKCIKKSEFHWTPEAEQAFKQLKLHLSELPLLVAPKPKEELIVYLAASYRAISAVLMTKRDKVQMPIYFVSRALQGPELNYTPMEKLVLALVFAAKRSSCVDGSGAGLILTSPEGTEFTYSLRFQFTASNNEAEYEALIAGLQIAAQMGVCNVHVLIKVLKEKSIQEEEVATVVEEEGPTWMTPIMEYLKDGTLLDDRKEASKLRIKARQYELFEEVLYRRSFLKPLLRKSQVFNSRYGLFYEVDKGEIRGDNHQQSSKEVRVGQHSVLLWPPRRNSLGQRVLLLDGDFVYRSNDASHAAAGEKLGPKWEGPYEVMEALRDRAYKRRTIDGADLPSTWNIANLKKCYL
ncbi:reverse transcriptase domain-containing protein [Tanacetum coccineum]|uniref:Reverse transcriptase domain-containing protein n=1 Tax=Tanacetum coccineum TaxID=301880 RepID=A0ABQ5F5J9_9ASTR